MLVAAQGAANPVSRHVARGSVLRGMPGSEADTTSGAEANAPDQSGWRVERPQHWYELPWSKEG